jgi:hypothetical protein
MSRQLMMIYFLTAIGQPPGGSSTIHIEYTFTQNNTQNDTKQQYIEQHKKQQCIEQQKYREFSAGCAPALRV